MSGNRRSPATIRSDVAKARLPGAAQGTRQKEFLDYFFRRSDSGGMANVSLSTASGRHAWRPTGRSGAEPAFQRARRHSRLVRRLRVGIPGGIVGGVLLYMLASWLNPFGALPIVPSMSQMMVSGSRVTMDMPRVSGYTRDGRAYEMSAAAAAQDLKRPQFIEMKEIRSKVEMKDGSRVTVTADTGVYDTKTEIVQLQGNVLVVSSDGTEARLLEAVMDMRKGHVVSQKPVEVSMKTGRIAAKQMEVVESGEVIHFTGGVTMDVAANAVSAAPEERR
ncbi:MAG: LPS export ABC transporter periplasmic protein LptC [Variibacter sp.]|nr:LPS export ABC transporter periplasmic protein LptC [Variibacter sp.]